MTKDNVVHQVHNLYKTNIIVEKKEGIFGRQSYSLVINEDGKTHKILQAFYQDGFWNSGCYKIFAQTNNITSIVQENKNINEQNQNDNNDIYCKSNLLNIIGLDGIDTLIKNNDEIELEHHSTNIQQLKQNESKLFKKFKKIKKRNINNNNNNNNNNSNGICVGNIESSGLFFDTTIIRDNKGASKGFLIYEATSRTGELMKLKIALPQINKESIANISTLIANTANIPDDLGLLIASFVGNVYWTKSLENLKLSNCNKFYKEQSQTLMKYHNKMPSWNPAIAAYTLEFCGRAVLPSVHNFQMADDNNNVVLQLGKVNDNTFNMDFGYPLSPFQAFSICLSVISRSFVWD